MATSTATTNHIAHKPLSSPLEGAFLLPQITQQTENEAGAKFGGAKIALFLCWLSRPRQRWVGMGEMLFH
ncbi:MULTISPECIES: hypothetical protein [unclassified Enterobacter]|uniref:hypothetical protein n=1 Tax=unclassified Enterobacter TaxID=2608935 RepID=UPI00126914F5|nr:MULTISPECIES: hypothetical protein [unclassified Enterobacter]